MHEWLLPMPTTAPGPTRPGRRVGLWCDDAEAARPWREALADEGLVLQDWRWPEAAGTGAGTPRPDAIALHLARGVTAQLGRLRTLCADGPGLPIVVACRGLRELDHVLALEMGADDVFDAALGAPVAAARLRALWRRSAPATPPAAIPAVLRFGPLVLQHAQRQVHLQGRPVDLTEGEFELLWRLAARAGEALARGTLLRELRGFSADGPDRSIDSRVYRIRQKLGGSTGAGACLRTIRNVGYLFSPMSD
ncbi:MAG: response regulator transcription factor [Burkholderiales bacterium]|nr:response regulator transcription factor [Burkholderiales bacterium]